jgi:alanine dehydrogenase
MHIGVPREIKDHEYRVGLTPEGVKLLFDEGHEVCIETRAGLRVGFPDAAYREAGARIANNPAEIYECELVVKVKELQPAEFLLTRPGQILFGFQHLAPDRSLLEHMLAAKVSCLAYETVTDAAGGLPLLVPMSQIAGRLSIQVGAWALQMGNGGSGVLLSGVPGVAPGKVLIIGGGTVGTNATQVAVGLGADVTVFDIDAARLKRLEQAYPGKLKTLVYEPEILARQVADADLMVGALLIPGRLSPKLIAHGHLRKMRPGSVLVDVSIDQGGIAETSRPTTHSQPIYVEEGVVHYCVTNMPAMVARTATLALERATLPYVQMVAGRGLPAAVAADAGLRNGLQIHNGHVTYSNLASDAGKPYLAPDRLWLNTGI